MAECGLSRLFSPITIKGLELKNRVVMPPMGTRYPTFGGGGTQRLIDYYVERARGGVGLIIVQFSPVSPEGCSSLYPLAIWDDAFVPRLRDLARAVQAEGARIAIQLAHAGGQTSSAFTRRPLVAPSAVPGLGRETPYELTQRQIAALVEAFAQAARRAVDAGFDAVELHMCHGYLLNQFLSPRYNRRTDLYGGDLAGRARFPLEALRRVRETAPDQVPVLCRLSADDAAPEGLELDEACKLAAMLEAAGADIIDVSAGVDESSEVSVPPMSFPPGYLLPYAAAIKASVGVPVIAVGKLHDPLIAERALAEGKADLIAVGRGLLADPEWANKAAEGRYEDIRPCLACNRPECHGRLAKQVGLGCVVNPALGREMLFRVSPALKVRRILVVGGGPAGLEAARIAALRGHKVILCEEQGKLGGQLHLAAAPPHKADVHQLTRYLVSQVDKLGVKVRLRCRVTPDLVAQVRPDAVIIATGARPVVPCIPGATEHTVTAWDVLAGTAQVGDRVVVVGGGDVGCEVAEYLAVQRKHVTIVEMLPDVAREYISWNHRLLVERLVAANVEILLQARAVSIEPSRLVYDRLGITNELAPIDTVVLACGASPQVELAQSLCDLGIQVHVIGDAAKPRNLADAVREGFEIGFAL